MSDLECIESGPDCNGPVEMRYPGYGTRSFARCEKHGHDRLAREELAQQRYPIHAPDDFDPSYAGETWDEEGY